MSLLDSLKSQSKCDQGINLRAKHSLWVYRRMILGLGFLSEPGLLAGVG
jgi:hypothetical protein